MKNPGKMSIQSVFLFLAVALISLGISTSSAHAVTLKGNIINMDEVKAYVEVDSFLQLFAIAEDGKIRVNFKTDDRGRRIYGSNLPQTAIPETGSFSISAPGLSPGHYTIISQKLKAWGLDKRGGHFLVKKGQKSLLDIEITSGADELIIDMGDLFIPVPDSKHL